LAAGFPFAVAAFSLFFSLTLKRFIMFPDKETNQ
jgi:hypothetical protein